MSTNRVNLGPIIQKAMEEGTDPDEAVRAALGQANPQPMSSPDLGPATASPSNGLTKITGPIPIDTEGARKFVQKATQDQNEAQDTNLVNRGLMPVNSPAVTMTNQAVNEPSGNGLGPIRGQNIATTRYKTQGDAEKEDEKRVLDAQIAHLNPPSEKGAVHDISGLVANLIGVKPDDPSLAPYKTMGTTEATAAISALGKVIEERTKAGVVKPEKIPEGVQDDRKQRDLLKRIALNDPTVTPAEKAEADAYQQQKGAGAIARTESMPERMYDMKSGSMVLVKANEAEAHPERYVGVSGTIPTEAAHGVAQIHTSMEAIDRLEKHADTVGNLTATQRGILINAEKQAGQGSILGTLNTELKKQLPSDVISYLADLDYAREAAYGLRKSLGGSSRASDQQTSAMLSALGGLGVTNKEEFLQRLNNERDMGRTLTKGVLSFLPADSQIPSNLGGGKSLDKATAQQILVESGGDKAKARDIAKQRGYKF